MTDCSGSSKVGDRDIAAGNVSVCHREKGDSGPRPIDEFLAELKAESDQEDLTAAAK